jgi:hypothetical protein
MMMKSEGVVHNGFVLRMSVPASGDMAAVGPEMAVKLAQQLGIGGAAAAGVGTVIADLARQVCPGGAADVSFEFHKSDMELTIEARQDGRSSETRIPLNA